MGWWPIEAQLRQLPIRDCASEIVHRGPQSGTLWFADRGIDLMEKSDQLGVANAAAVSIWFTTPIVSLAPAHWANARTGRTGPTHWANALGQRTGRGHLSSAGQSARANTCQRGFFLVSRLVLERFFGAAAAFLSEAFFAVFLAGLFFRLAAVLLVFFSRDAVSVSLAPFLLDRFGNRSLASGAISSMMARTRGENGAFP